MNNLNETILKSKDLQREILKMSEQIKWTLDKYLVYIFTFRKKKKRLFSPIFNEQKYLFS